MCSLGCLKVFVGFSSILVSLIGIAGIIIVAVGLNDLSIYTGDVHEYLYIFKWSLIGFFIFVLICGLFGILGSWKKNACLLFIYDITLFIFLICMFIISITGTAFLTYQNRLETDANNVCAGESISNGTNSFTSLFKQQSQFAQFAQTYLCSPQCPCNMSPTTLSTLRKDNNTQNFDTDSSDNVVSIQQCALFKDEATYNQSIQQYSQVSWAEYNTYVTSMNLLETELHCSGICNSAGYYIFSNINNGNVGAIPSCKTKMFDFLQSKATYVCVLGWIIFSYIFITMICSCCICCKNKKMKKQDKTGVTENLNSYYVNRY